MIDILHDAPLKARNTFAIAAKADMIIEYDTVVDLCSLAPLHDFMHIGGGSNLLFVGDCHTTLLHSMIGGIERVAESRGDITVRVGAGVVWDDFVAWSIAEGLAGAENLSLIPGEVGAAAVQNIGAYGVEAADLIEAVDAVDMHTGRICRFNRSELEYAYRFSAFKRPEMKRYAITHVYLRLHRYFHPVLSYAGISQYLDENRIKPTPATMRRAIIALRSSKLPDPARIGNAGSFFTNPIVSADLAATLKRRYPEMPQYPVEGSTDRIKLSGGWLIEQAGWKGRSIGPAGVDARQALVLVNHGGATGAEVLAVADAVIADVHTRFGVRLTPEVNIIPRPVRR